MDIHFRFTLDAPRGWQRRIMQYVVIPFALVAGLSTAVWAYDTSWIESGQQLSASALKGDLDEIQTRLQALEGREPVHRAILSSTGEVIHQSGEWIDDVDHGDTGIYEILFADDAFTTTPTCVATAYSGNQVPPVFECYQAFNTGIVCATGTSGVGVDTGVFLVCVGS